MHNCKKQDKKITHLQQKQNNKENSFFSDYRGLGKTSESFDIANMSAADSSVVTCTEVMSHNIPCIDRDSRVRTKS